MQIATDWDRYYQRPARLAGVTRRITAAALVAQMRRFAPPRPTVAELGGANSCFLNVVQARLRPQEYHVIDNNQFGLECLQQRIGRSDHVRLHRQNVLDLSLPCLVDLAFSIGLVEHFSPADTRRAVEAHFDVLKSGGIAIIGFPTPTRLYRLARRSAELIGAWRFHDERPLELAEVHAAACRYGRMLCGRILWPLVFTQYLTVWRKS